MDPQTDDRTRPRDTGGHPRTPPEPFFRHAPQAADAAGQPLQSATRYLSAAVYLDQRLCDRVIAEFLDDEHRAVVPSFGFDLGPVILHAVRARRFRLVRDLAIIAVFVVAWLLVPAIAALYLLVTLLLHVPWRRLRWRWRLAIGWVVALGLAPVVLFGLLGGQQGLDGYEEQDNTGFLDSMQTDHALLTIVLLFLVMATIVFGHLAVVFYTLARDLGPGATGPGPRTYSERVRLVIERVRSAQHGNVTLYSGANPFIGAGDVTAPWSRVWSIALELDRAASGSRPPGADGDAASAGPDSPGAAASPDGSGSEPAPRRVDAVTIHERIRAKILRMRDEALPPRPGEPAPEPTPLPPNERITGLVSDVHIVGRGRCPQRTRPVDAVTGRWFQGHPLIDATAGVPFSVASPEAVEAMMRHPQADLRCYQRVTVAGHGQAIDAPDGRPVAPAEEKDVVLSAFVYLAVEGRMLYGQFVATVLPPVREEYRIVDRLPDWDAVTLLFRTLTESWRTVLAGTLLAWPRMLTTCWTMARSLVAATSSGNPARKTSHDYGARISVRELFAEDGFATFVQETDVDKYMRLIERRVNEAILDYLSDECGIDVSAYRAQAGVILNQGVIMTGGTVHGQVASGRSVEQRQTRINP
ncbi:hypothetical protein [Actinomadura montaniterrae]|uniref:Uncharacterized protein n=1 Tax=Actinomadura montaniterrae TaxID=1803903 RepID=A0A6L3VSX2_9ACTN|nr:hypothetical protein [Actinomadura montaniterrae]KAB2370844.1 hypothetical protein F9B16_34015 [Actinomadura montaniterrae]